MEHPVSQRALAYFDDLYPLDRRDVCPKVDTAPTQPPANLAGGRQSPALSPRSRMTLAGSEVSKRYGDVSEIKAGGATYTPRELADFVADQMLEVAELPTARPIRVLDPALGHGELLHSLLARLKGEVEVYGFETDPNALQVVTERLTKSYPSASFHFVEGSFLDHVIDDFESGLLRSTEHYDLIIANPPYPQFRITYLDCVVNCETACLDSGHVVRSHAHVFPRFVRLMVSRRLTCPHPRSKSLSYTNQIG